MFSKSKYIWVDFTNAAVAVADETGLADAAVAALLIDAVGVGVAFGGAPRALVNVRACAVLLV